MSQTTLLLFAHGPTKPGKLTTRAKRQAQKLGVWMQENALRPHAVLTSMTEGSIVSAQKALKSGGWPAQNIVSDADLFQGPPSEQVARLAKHLTGQLFCCGNPDEVSALLHHVIPGPPELEPGALAHLTCTGVPLVPDTVRLESIVVADTLPDGFPYPGPGSEERRPRPAYYYTQSAVLPYRLRDGETEILLITSSSGRKWGIPKGICEPGLSPQASAAQEAFEEAGVRGRVHQTPIGRYDLPKWGASTRVTVYPMQVTEILPEAVREEPQRKREWIEASEAAGRVTAPELADMIASFDAD